MRLWPDWRRGPPARDAAPAAPNLIPSGPSNAAGGGTAGLVALEDLTLGYDRHPAVHHVCVDIASGALLAVVGPNGGGKSTLLKALAGLLTPLSGHLRWREAHAPRMAYLPQLAEMDRSFPITVADMVAMGLWHEVGALGGYSTQQRQRCAQALDAVGMGGFGQRTVDTLSGGQFQRALFARLMLQDASLILLDEPFSSMDRRTTDDLMTLIGGWQGQGRTVITVLHDLALVRRYFPTTLLLARELIAYGPTAQVLTDQHLAQAGRMNEAFDDHAAACEPINVQAMRQVQEAQRA